MDRIHLDYTHALADVVGGEHGVDEAELRELADPSRAALESVLARKDRDLRWLGLHHATDVHDEILQYAASVRGQFRNIVVLGIGGSALGTRALHDALASPYHNLAPPAGIPRLFVLDNVDPDLIGEFLDTFDPTETLFNVISKSGGTAETMSQLLIVRQALVERLGEEGHRAHLVCTTDVEKGVLREIVEREGYASFVVPDGVGGRFSVLSPVGLLPLALLGIDIKGLCAGAASMEERCANPDLFGNPAAMYAALQWLLQSRKSKPMAITFAYGHRLASLADWYAQLLGESIGKRLSKDGREVFTGPTPIRAVGVTDQHSQVQLYVEGPYDKWFTILQIDRPDHAVKIPGAWPDLEGAEYLAGRDLGELFAAERDGTRIALTEARRPNVTIRFGEVSPRTIGEYLYMMELSVALMGEHYQVDAFDQPGVEAGKIAAYALMGRSGFEERRAEIERASQRPSRSL